MRLIKTKDYDDMSRKAAAIISSQVTLKPNSVLGLATGSTVEGLYEILAKEYEDGLLDFSDVTSINLDEYAGLAPDHDQSYDYFMSTNLFNKINIHRNNTYLPDGTADNMDEECRRYDSIIETFGPLDLQLLGLGHNGHIGFNEPADSFSKGTQYIKLTDETIKANSRFFNDESEVPRGAVTMGIGSIMKSKTALLCVSGSGKAEILKEVLEGPVKPQVPGSILQLHNDVIVIADADALKYVEI